MASLFKRAAVRGIAHELVNRGLCEFPSKEAMEEAADAVADGPAAEPLPETSGPEGHSPEDVVAIANKLMEIAQALMAQASGGGAPGGMGAAPGGALDAGGGGGGAPPMDPAAAALAKQGAEQLKVACARDLGTVASEAALACMDKAAAEMKQASDPKLVGGGSDHKNTPSAAAKNDSVAALDLKNRPEGAHLVGMGNTKLETGKGEIGHLGAPTVQPSNSPSGSNSVNSDSKKHAAMKEALLKAANKLVGLHDSKKNTLENSPDSLAKLDLKNRGGASAYVVPQGGANFSEPQDARIGKEKKVERPLSPAGSNSVIQASKAAGELTAEEQAQLELFQKCAEDVGAWLPKELSEEEKIAAIEGMIPLNHDARQVQITTLHEKVAAAKAAAPAPEQKKESALLARVKEIAQKATAAQA